MITTLGRLSFWQKKTKHEGPKMTGQLETMVLRGRVLEPHPTAKVISPE